MGAEVPGASIVDQLTTPEGVHLDDTGEQRLRKLDPVLKDLRTLGELYEKWQRCGASKNNTLAAGCWNDQPKFGDGREERVELPKLRSSNFGYIYGAYSRINHLHSAGEQLEKTAARGVTNVKASWKGKASDAAIGDVHALGTTAENYQEILKTAGSNVMGLWRAMTSAVQKLADFSGGRQGTTLSGYVEQYHGTSVSVDAGMFGDITVELPDRAALNSYVDQMNLALRNGLAHAESGVTDVVKGALIGGPIGGLVGLGYAMQDPEPSSDPGGTRIGGQGLREPGMCKLDGGHGDWWSNEACGFFDKFAEDYYAVVKDLRKRITQTTKAVDEGLGQFTSGVSGLTSDPFGTLAPPDGGSDGGSDGGDDSRDTRPSHRRGHTPSSSHPPDDGGGTTPAGHDYQPDTGGHDGSGRQGPLPDELRRERMSLDGGKETVTISHGDETISMSSLDGTGTMSLTVDDGKGRPTTYDVDFGQSGSDLPAGADLSGGGSGPAWTGGDGDTRHIQADANGQAVIHDGDETITLEHASDGSGELTVTVDDGKGEPTTYTVDTDPESPSGGRSSHGATPAGVPDDHGSTSEQQAAAGGGLGIGGGAGGTAGGGSGSAGGAVPGTSESGASGPQPGARTAVATDQPQSQAPRPTSTEPAAASAQSGEGRGGGMRGMPMMGGMGAGGKGGDSERGTSKWRTSGDLFDDLSQVDPQTGMRPVDGVIGERRGNGG